MNPFMLMAGVLLGLLVMVVPFLWSLYRAAVAQGPLRWAHLAACLMTAAGAASISWLLPGPALIAGGVLLVIAVYLMIRESRWNKLFPLRQAAFAMALIAGLPFAG